MGAFKNTHQISEGISKNFKFCHFIRTELPLKTQSRVCWGWWGKEDQVRLGGCWWGGEEEGCVLRNSLGLYGHDLQMHLYLPECLYVDLFDSTIKGICQSKKGTHSLGASILESKNFYYH